MKCFARKVHLFDILFHAMTFTQSHWRGLSVQIRDVYSYKVRMSKLCAALSGSIKDVSSWIEETENASLPKSQITVKIMQLQTIHYKSVSSIQRRLRQLSGILYPKRELLIRTSSLGSSVLTVWFYP